MPGQRRRREPLVGHADRAHHAARSGVGTFARPCAWVVQMLVLAREPGRMLDWQCISAHDASTPASEWTGTTITFALGERASSAAASGGWARQIPVQTVLSFTHQGWKEGARFFAFCNTAWGTVLQQLKDCATLEPHH